MKGYPWFRLYTDVRNDAKLRSLTPEQRDTWLSLLCFAAEQPVRGTISGRTKELIAVECHADVTLYHATVTRLVALRIININENGDVSFINFEKLQYDKPSDTPKETAKRKGKQRKQDQIKKCHADVTPPTSNVTQQIKNRVTDTEKDIRNNSGGETPPRKRNQGHFIDNNDPRYFTDYYFAMCEAMKTTPEILGRLPKKRMEIAAEAVNAENLGYTPEHIRQSGRNCKFKDPSTSQILVGLESAKNPPKENLNGTHQTAREKESQRLRDCIERSQQLDAEAARIQNSDASLLALPASGGNP